MRSLKVLVMAITVMALLCVGSTAFAKTKTATITADVIVADLVSAVTATAVNFGELSYTNGTQTGYAILNSASGYATAVTGDTTAAGGGTVLDSTNGFTVVTAGASGSLTITASAAGSISAIAFPDITLATGNPGETVALTLMSSYSEDPTAAALSSGANIYYLGGALAMTSATVAGTYQGTGTCTVTY
jgi:hypothetical protein